MMGYSIVLTEQMYYSPEIVVILKVQGVWCFCHVVHPVSSVSQSGSQVHVSCRTGGFRAAIAISVRDLPAIKDEFRGPTEVVGSTFGELGVFIDLVSYHGSVALICHFIEFVDLGKATGHY